MSVDQMETGMATVVNQLEAFSREAGLVVEPIAWYTSTETHDSRHLLAVSVNGQRQLLAFADSDLEDLPADEGVQSGIESHLRAFIRSEKDRVPA